MATPWELILKVVHNITNITIRKGGPKKMYTQRKKAKN